MNLVGCSTPIVMVAALGMIAVVNDVAQPGIMATDLHNSVTPFTSDMDRNHFEANHFIFIHGVTSCDVCERRSSGELNGLSLASYSSLFSMPFRIRTETCVN